jgi:hypothetical protein
MQLELLKGSAPAEKNHQVVWRRIFFGRDVLTEFVNRIVFVLKKTFNLFGTLHTQFLAFFTGGLYSSLQMFAF